MIQQGQEPQNHQLLLVGSGRLATHFAFYLRSINCSFHQWSRRTHSSQELKTLLKSVEHVALAISDDGLAPFIDQNLLRFQGRISHFSGAWHRNGIVSTHPLMSFGPHLYQLSDYKKIHFTIEGADSLSRVFPRLENPWSVLSADRKSLYHALCVLGGNFPLLLWSKMEKDLRTMGIPTEAMHLYIQKISQNYIDSGETALTGPLVRGDKQTIERNINALAGDPWEKVYRAFQEVYREHS